MTTLSVTAEGFGFTIIGGDKLGDLVRIGSIVKGGVAEKDGKLMAGDVLSAVNGTSLKSFSNQDVNELFGSFKLNDDVTFEVLRGNTSHIAMCKFGFCVLTL